jgi:hypothetical protein
MTLYFMIPTLYFQKTFSISIYGCLLFFCVHGGLYSVDGFRLLYTAFVLCRHVVVVVNVVVVVAGVVVVVVCC